MEGGKVMESGLLIKKMAVFGSKAFDVVLFVILWIAGFIFLLCVLPIVLIFLVCFALAIWVMRVACGD